MTFLTEVESYVSSCDRKGTRRRKADLVLGGKDGEEEKKLEEEEEGDEEEESNALMASGIENSFHIRKTKVNAEKKVLEKKSREENQAWKLQCDEIEKEFMQFNVLNEEKLLELTNKDELADIVELKYCVDTSYQDVSHLGSMLPCLKELWLDNSSISTIRDFGTQLGQLRVLSLKSSYVKELDGICALDNLQELYLENNSIESLAPLAMHESLRLVDLRENCISDIGEIDQLGTCFQLRNLSLKGNPVSLVDFYRRFVSNSIPQLEVLDNFNIVEADQKPLADEDMVRAVQVSGQTKEESKRDDLNGDHVKQAADHTEKNYDDSAENAENDVLSASSELTHGTTVIFAGNLASSMRRRKRAVKSTSSEQRLRQAAANFRLEELREEERLNSARSDSSTSIHSRPELDSLPSARSYADGQNGLDEDENVDIQLEKLLALSNGLEKELHRLRTYKGEYVQSPKAKRLQKRKKSSTAVSDVCEYDRESDKRPSSHKTKASRHGSKLKTPWKPIPPDSLRQEAQVEMRNLDEFRLNEADAYADDVDYYDGCKKTVVESKF